MAQPVWLKTYYPFEDGFLKKRARPYLINHYKYSIDQDAENYYYALLLLFKINHYKYSIDQDAENYYYALLLLFKPWRNSESLMGSSDSYQTEFEQLKGELPDALKYHDKLQQLWTRDEIVRDQIDK